jgi:hypothetical protein
MSTALFIRCIEGNGPSFDIQVTKQSSRLGIGAAVNNIVRIRKSSFHIYAAYIYM